MQCTDNISGLAYPFDDVVLCSTVWNIFVLSKRVRLLGPDANYNVHRCIVFVFEGVKQMNLSKIWQGD